MWQNDYYYQSACTASESLSFVVTIRAQCRTLPAARVALMSARAGGGGAGGTGSGTARGRGGRVGGGETGAPSAAGGGAQRRAGGAAGAAVRVLRSVRRRDETAMLGSEHMSTCSPWYQNMGDAHAHAHAPPPRVS